MDGFGSESGGSLVLDEHPAKACYCREGKGWWHGEHDVCGSCGGSLVLGPWNELGWLRDDLDDYVIIVDDRSV